MNPDDPRLTAYALNELNPAERAEMERLLRDDSIAAEEVETMRAFTVQLRTRLHAEPQLGLHPAQRAEAQALAARETPKPKAFVGQGGRWLALAAGVALGVGIALLFPALNSWKPGRVVAGSAQSRPRSGEDVQVSLNAESLVAAKEAIVSVEWSRDEMPPGIPNLPVVTWSVGRMTFEVGDPSMRFDVKLPTIDFSPPPTAPVAVRASSEIPRAKARATTGAKTLREARYATVPAPATPIFDWSIPRKGEPAE